MAAAVVLAAVSLGVGVASTVQSQSAQRKGQKEAKKANELRARADAIQQNRERRKVIREARVKAAQVNSATNATGAGNSSAASGSIGDIQTTGASQVNFLDQVGGLTSMSNTALSKANDYYSQSETFSGIANAGFSFAGYAGSTEGGNTINKYFRKVF